MPVFTLPTFNLIGDAWTEPFFPDQDEADIVDVPVQLYIYSRGAFDINIGFLELWSPPIYVRIDPAFGALSAALWIWEIPQGSARYYRVRFKSLIHEGFPNEYTFHLVSQCDGTGVEILRDVVPNPPPPEE